MRVNQIAGVCIQTQISIFSLGNEMSLSTVAASALSVACSMLTVQQQRKLCCWFVFNIH